MQYALRGSSAEVKSKNFKLNARYQDEPFCGDDLQSFDGELDAVAPVVNEPEDVSALQDAASVEEQQQDSSSASPLVVQQSASDEQKLSDEIASSELHQAEHGGSSNATDNDADLACPPAGDVFQEMQQGFTPGKAVIHIDLEAIDINMQEFLDAQRDYVEQRGKRGLLNDFAWLPLANYTEKKILRKQTFDEFAFSYRVFAPKKYRTSILQYFHCSPLDAGHQGRDTTLARIRRHFLWEGMRRQVRAFCRACKICAQSKRRAIVRAYPRSSMLTHPFDSYEIDFVGPLTPCMDFVYILTCICRFSGWIFLRCVKEATSEAVAKFLFEGVVCSYGPFRELRSDRGSHFIAQIIIKMSEMFHFRHVRGSAYNPTSQSLIERTHRLLIEYLRSFLLHTGGRADWVQYVMPFQWAF
ncbi:unnamed protein product [Amoebophrya sp. A25]|nr:unnamed protein product [Amoebophrya sp. A25]|eukprot:GSA25T00019303001.1